MYFNSSEHERNFKLLVMRYGCSNIPDKKSACYVIGHPRIYEILNGSPGEKGPFEWYFGEYDDDEGRYKEGELVSLLSSAYQNLVRAAVELYTGRQYGFDLTRITSWDGDVFQTFVQALEVRRAKA